MISTPIQSSTRVDFPSGSIASSSKVILADFLNQDTSKVFVIVENTPFHPVNYKWPDQPADIGFMTLNDRRFRVTNTLTGAVDLSNYQLYLDQQIPVHKGDDGWIFVVAHVIDFDADLSPSDLLGENVLLQVDSERRSRISISHSASHLMALALNKCAKRYWRKDVKKDSLGNPDLDQLAIQMSKIGELRNKDLYRVGKSSKKKGFDPSAFLANISEVEECINSQLSEWLTADTPISLEPRDSKIDIFRVWSCELPDGIAKVPCGGTHVSSLSQISAIHVTLEKSSDEPEFVVHTSVKPSDQNLET